MAAGAAIGIAAVLAAIPGSDLALKVAGTGYLAWLAYQIAASGDVDGGGIARPMRLGQAILFQFLNPKGWLFALAAISAYRMSGVPVVVASAIVVVTMMAIVIPSAALWAAGGTVLRPLVSDARRHRALSVALALLLAATIALIWM